VLCHTIPMLPVIVVFSMTCARLDTYPSVVQAARLALKSAFGLPWERFVAMNTLQAFACVAPK